MQKDEVALSFIINLAIGQLKLASRESGNSVGTLSSTFINMVQDVGKLKDILERDETKPLEVQDRLEALDICKQYLDKTAAGTVGFQFYDMLSQRMESLMKTLDGVNKLLAEHNGQPSAKDYQDLIEDIQNRYTIAKDHALFESLKDGNSIDASVADALKFKQEDIELF